MEGLSIFCVLRADQVGSACFQAEAVPLVGWRHCSGVLGARVPVPAGLVGHSTCSVATSWAALRGVSLSEICSAVTWSSPCAFTRFYKLNVALATSLVGSVLFAGAQRWSWTSVVASGRCQVEASGLYNFWNPGHFWIRGVPF